MASRSPEIEPMTETTIRDHGQKGGDMNNEVMTIKFKIFIVLAHSPVINSLSFSFSYCQHVIKQQYFD